MSDYLDSSTWETIGVTSDGQRTIMRNPANGLACCYSLDGHLVTPEVYEAQRIKRIRDAAEDLLAALECIARGLTNGQKERGETFQSIARDAIAKATGVAA